MAITCGDPAGVGPEIIEGILSLEPDLLREIVVIGPAHWTESLHEQLGVQIRSVGPGDIQIKAGQPSVEGAALALEAMEIAALGCQEGRFRAVVTGPISKYWLKQVGFDFPGQTEFFAQVWGGDPTMAFLGERLRVVLATWHLPLADVPRALTAACLERAVIRAHELGRRLGLTEPRIGVCGLNPHAGEAGILGLEEMEVLDPTLNRLRRRMPGLSACLPGDTVFFRHLRGEFDLVVAAYHDQGLAPLKALEFDRAVNLTLGLPYLRTSPDHGTAFELAGRGLADGGSFRAAIQRLRELTT